MQYKANSRASKVQKEMATPIAPVAIGTKGTVGSLLRKEIEYFGKLEINSGTHKSSCKGHSRTRLWSLLSVWRHKRRRTSSGFVPGICSAVEVADTSLINGISGFGYKVLKEDN